MNAGSGGMGAVSAGIGELVAIVILAIALLVLGWYAVKLLLAAFRG